MYTPLLRTAIIPEKGVELGWVIGGQTTGGQDIENDKSYNTNMVAEGLKQSKLKEQSDGIIYCPDMGNLELPSYKTAYFKPGYSGKKSQAEKIQTCILIDKICKVCKDGPKCKFAKVRRAGHKILDGSPCAASTRVAPKDILHTVPTVQLPMEKPEVLAQAKEGVNEIDYVNVYGVEERFNTRGINSLIVKWEGIGGEVHREEGGGGGSQIGRRRSAEFSSRLNIFEHRKVEIPDNIQHKSFSSIFNATHISQNSESYTQKARQSHRMRGSLLLVERTANEKRGRADNEGGSQTKKSRRTENPGGD